MNDRSPGRPGRRWRPEPLRQDRKSAQSAPGADPPAALSETFQAGADPGVRSCVIVYTLLGLLGPYLMGVAIDQFIDGKDPAGPGAHLPC